MKAANIPASTVGVIDVPYRGRTLKIAGDRTLVLSLGQLLSLTTKDSHLDLSLKSGLLRSKHFSKTCRKQKSSLNISLTLLCASMIDRVPSLDPTNSLVSGLLTSLPLTLHGIATILLKSIPLNSKFQCWTYANDVNMANGV